MPWFRKHHTCPCGTDWWDEWDCLCNDRCPTCDAEIEPDEHEAIQGGKSAKIRALNDRFRKSLTGGRVMMTAAVSALPNDVRARTIELTRKISLRTTIRTTSTISAASRSMTRNSFSNMTTTTSRCSTVPKIQVTKKTTRVLTIMLADEY